MEKLIESSDEEYFGIRAADELLPIGSIAPCSHRWDDGEWTDDMLTGASAIAVSQDLSEISEALQMLRTYGGDYIYLLGSTFAEGGEDVGEIVMKNAVVLGRWKHQS